MLKRAKSSTNVRSTPEESRLLADAEAERANLQRQLEEADAELKALEAARRETEAKARSATNEAEAEVKAAMAKRAQVERDYNELAKASDLRHWYGVTDGHF